MAEGTCSDHEMVESSQSKSMCKLQLQVEVLWLGLVFIWSLVRCWALWSCPGTTGMFYSLCEVEAFPRLWKGQHFHTEVLKAYTKCICLHFQHKAWVHTWVCSLQFVHSWCHWHSEWFPSSVWCSILIMPIKRIQFSWQSWMDIPQEQFKVLFSCSFCFFVSVIGPFWKSYISVFF